MVKQIGVFKLQDEEENGDDDTEEELAQIIGDMLD